MVLQLTWSAKAKSDPKLFTAPPPLTVWCPTPLQISPVPDRLHVSGTELPLGISDLYDWKALHVKIPIHNKTTGAIQLIKEMTTNYKHTARMRNDNVEIPEWLISSIFQKILISIWAKIVQILLLSKAMTSPSPHSNRWNHTQTEMKKICCGLVNLLAQIPIANCIISSCYPWCIKSLTRDDICE